MDVAATMIVDQALRELWPNARVSLSIHNVPHERVHDVGGEERAVFSSGTWSVTAPLGASYGLSPQLFGVAEQACEHCQSLISANREQAAKRAEASDEG